MSAAAGGPGDPAAAFVGASWVDVVPRRVACPQLPADVLLHAGPPLKGPPPPPLFNAAVQALLYEGLAGDAAEAGRRLAAGQVLLRPAQEHRIVTPLAQVVSASMPLFAVRHHAEMAWGAVLEGPAPALRFGSCAPACRQRLAQLAAWLDADIAPRLRRTPLPLEELIREAVAAGEDCHSRTAVANAALAAALAPGGGAAGRDAIDGELEALRALPAFVLPLLMAAAAASLRHHGGAVEAVGGNGVEIGVRHRGTAEWRTAAAAAPCGERFAGQEHTAALPAIGDSVVIDYCGLGGLIDAPLLRAGLVGSSGIVEASRVAAGVGPPVFNLAILDAAGVAGLIGRGSYRPPVDVFAA